MIKFKVALEAMTEPTNKTITIINGYDIHSYFYGWEKIVKFIRDVLLGKEEFDKQVKTHLKSHMEEYYDNCNLNQSENRFGFHCQFKIDMAEEELFYYTLKHTEEMNEILKVGENKCGIF